MKFSEINYCDGRGLMLHMMLLLAMVSGSHAAQCQASEMTSADPQVWFDQRIGIENTGLINGPEYKANMPGASTNAFFGDGEMKGAVSFDGQWYNANLLYDAFKDEIVVKHLSSSGRAWFVELEKTRVQGFVLSGREFRGFTRGFHEVIFDSPHFLVVCKRAKVSQLQNSVFNYVTNDEFFIVDANRWRPLRSASAFLKLVDKKEDKTAIKSFISDHDIRIRKFKSEDLRKIATFIHSLRKPS